MARPSDYEDVFGFADPTPGDPYEIRQVARTWGSVADNAAYAGRQLGGLLGDDALVQWVGRAGDAFRKRSSDLPDQLKKVADSYDQASAAMDWWAGRLETHQSTADGALIDGRAAQRDLTSARSSLSSAESRVSNAADDDALSSTTSLSVEQIQAAKDRLRSAERAQTAAQGLVDDAQGRLDAARLLAQDAHEARNTDAQETERRIHEASDAGIPERSRWQKFKDGVAGAWDILVSAAKIIVAVLGVVVLIIGGPLAWVVFAAALIVLADTLMKYANGQASLFDVGLALLDCIPGTKGLTTLGRLKTMFAGGLLVGGGLMLRGIARSVRGMVGGLRTTLVTFRGAMRLRVHNMGALARGFRAMVKSDFGLLGSIRRIPELLRVPMPSEGTTVYRVFGEALDASGAGLSKGSRAGGASWTPTDWTLADDFRWEAGLPDENPMRFAETGDLVDPFRVDEIRLALPLDGNPGGWPEYMIPAVETSPGNWSDALDAVDLTDVQGVNIPGVTTPPGGWTPPGP